ncbi:protein-serine/threonine phosphatase [Malassezia japonica]|uniref:Protein-serine/threonine phosphatase n=1 Tax=Malassezia japonica TaxID=223818 RepID=A0AAF0F403_9BASI|nr:protein-serine/threonine phosphatase [Malassezia japonica]WFD39454.1 protein-serine/threonine phosphatase [Malassezia japonica]
MEDAHLSILDFDDVPGQAFFGMFDGHAGKFAAEWCRDHLAPILQEELHKHPQMDVREVLNNTFLHVDRQLEIDSESAGVRSGCTAVTSLLRVEVDDAPEKKERRVLYTANVGDARSVLCRNGRAVRLTYDHKGSDEREAKRITEKGGFLLNNRVNGVLAVTRSLGDFSMKEFVVGSPFTTSIELEEGDTFLIVACDGLWDVISDQDAVDHIVDVADPQEASEKLLKYALDNFSTDNTSVMVSSAADPPPDAADTSPLDFSKRAVPAWLNGSDSEAEVTPAPSRRMSLLSDALRSPTASQEAQFTPSGLTSGILKHGLLQEPKVCEPRPAMAAARTHFVEPEKPHRYRWSRSHSTHAPLHKSESELPAESATRRTSITFIEPRSRARSTSPRFQSTRNVFAKETAVLGIDDEDVIDDEDTIDDKDAVDDELADESSESDEAADNDKEAADKHSDDQETLAAAHYRSTM